MTAPALSGKLQEQYRKIIKNLSITVAVLDARSNLVYVMGKWKTPIFIS